MSAGPCGLAIARQLGHRQGIDALVVDRATAPASSWRARCDGFRLNTCGYWSHLPGQRIPRADGRWPSRDAMVAYFDDYARRQRVRLRLGVTVLRVDADGDRWQVTTHHETLSAAAVVVATGNYHTPAIPPWPGMEGYGGDLLHSQDYRNAAPFAGRDVLVVGAGNSATDVVLQLARSGAERIRMSVRTPPHLVPRSAAGIPVDAFSPAFVHLPVPVLDRAAAVMRRLWFGDLAGAGLPVPDRGIYTALLEDAQIPTIADELVPLVRSGRVEIVSAVESFDGNRVLLVDGTSLAPDAVIAATGYLRGLEPMVGHLGVLDGDGHPTSSRPGLWFSGYDEPLIGPLRAMRRRSGPLARDVARHLTVAG